jgi:dihydrolipoamide dehydrogenase
MPETQVAVIGAGPGGYAAAFLAADLGLDVTLVDPQRNPGGVCLYRGCIPSKTLLHVAHLLKASKDASRFGVTFGDPKIDLEKLRGFTQSVVDDLTNGLGALCKQRKIRFVQAGATFDSPTVARLRNPKGKEASLKFEHAILATGSRPVSLPNWPKSRGIMDSSAALRLPDVPGSLLVVGGGYIGLELGSVYAALGSRVTVVEMMPGLLPGVDRDLVRVLEKELKEEFERIHLETKVAEIREESDKMQVTFEGAVTEKQVFDKVLVSVGRRPNSSDLGLENTKVEVDKHGFIQVDEKRRTAEPTIFAIGDVAGQPMLAHKASHEGRVAAETIAGREATFQPAAIPAVVFTDPEIAWAGLTEEEAKAAGREVKVSRFPWAASGRAKTLGGSGGVTKLLIDPETERLLGAAIVGPSAGEMIAEAVLAMEMKAKASDLKLTIHPHPTLSETIMEAAEVFFGQATHLYRPKRK